jgi:iron complex outermembrane recepter protein
MLYPVKPERLLSAILMLILVSCSVYGAQAAPDSLAVRKVYYLDGINVVGESLGKTIGAVDVKEFDRENVTTDTAVSNLISDMAGVFLTEKSKGESIVRLRGFEDRHIRVLVDGMPISDGYFGKYDLHMMSANNIKRINLVKGPVAHQYGFNTMGGILNIISDNHNEEKAFLAKFLYSSHGRTQASFNSSFGLGRSQLYLSSSYMNTPGFLLPHRLTSIDQNSIEEGGKRRTNSMRDQYGIDLRFVTDIAGLHFFSFATGYSYTPEKGNPPSLYDHVDNRNSKIEDWMKLNASLTYKSNLFESIDLTSSVYFDQSEDTYILFSDAQFDNALWKSLIRSSTYGFHLNLNRNVNNIFDHDLGLRVEEKSYNRKGGPGYESGWADNSQSMAKIYHSVYVPIGKDKLSIVAGNALSSFTHTQTDDYNFYWEPQVGLDYRMGVNNISLSYGISNQFPTMRELFSSTSGNPDLKAETAYKAEAVYRTPFAHGNTEGTISVAAFHNRIDDLIRRDRSLFYNQERMSTFGSEINLYLSCFKWLHHDYEVSFIKLDKSNSSVSLLEYPEIKLRLSHRLKVSNRFSIDLSSRWFDESLTYYIEGDYFRLPSYWTNDIGFTYRHSLAKLKLNAANIFDTYYEPQYGYPAAGREVTLAVEIPLF